MPIGGGAGRGWGEKCPAFHLPHLPTCLPSHLCPLPTCLHCPIQASEAAISRWQPLLRPAVPLLPGAGQLTAALEKPARADQKQKRSGCAGSLLPRRDARAQPCQAGFQLEERGCGHGAAPSRHPPGPLPAHGRLTEGWGLAQRRSPASMGPAAAPQEGAQPFVPASLRPSGQKLAAPRSQHSGLSSHPQADCWEGMFPQPVLSWVGLHPPGPVLCA